MVHFLAFYEAQAKKVTYPTLTPVKGFVCKTCTCCQDLIFGIREESEKKS